MLYPVFGISCPCVCGGVGGYPVLVLVGVGMVVGYPDLVLAKRNGVGCEQGDGYPVLVLANGGAG